MKKIFFNAVVSLITVSAALYSCSKDENVVEQRLESKENTQEAYFTKVGGHHNSVLDDVIKQCNLEIKDAKERFQIAKQITGSNSVWEESHQDSKLVYDITDDKVAVRDVFTLKDAKFGEGVLSLMDELDNILDNALTRAEQDTPVLPIEYSMQIDELIAKTYTNYDVQLDLVTDVGNEYALFIGACAVSKASYAYWYNVAITSSLPWNAFLRDNKKSIFGKIWHGIKVAGVDTWSFMTAPNCGSADQPNGYSLRCAWNYAGEQSSSVE